MYVGRRTLNASFERTTGVSRGNAPPRMSLPTTTQRRITLNVAVVHAAATPGLNPTPSARSRAKASTTGASAGTAGAMADQHDAHAPGKHQRIAETASAKAACPPAPRRERGVAPGRFARMRAMSPGASSAGASSGTVGSAAPSPFASMPRARSSRESFEANSPDAVGASSSPNTSG